MRKKDQIWYLCSCKVFRILFLTGSRKEDDVVDGLNELQLNHTLNEQRSKQPLFLSFCTMYTHKHNFNIRTHTASYQIRLKKILLRQVNRSKHQLTVTTILPSLLQTFLKTHKNTTFLAQSENWMKSVSKFMFPFFLTYQSQIFLQSGLWESICHSIIHKIQQEKNGDKMYCTKSAKLYMNKSLLKLTEYRYKHNGEI